MEFADTLRIEPLPCPRPRITARGRWAHAYYPASYKKWKDEFKELFANRPALPCFEHPVFVKATFAVTRPKTTKLLTPKGDLDNYVKSLLDGLNSVGIWTDDKLVTRGIFEKRFTEPGEEGHIDLYINVPAAYLKFKKRK